MLVAGQSLTQRPAEAPATKVARAGGFFPRLIALIVDSMILTLLFVPMYALWVSQLSPVAFTPGGDVAGELAQRRLALDGAYAVIYLFYFAGSWTMLGATPGQLLMSLRVTNANAEGIGFFKALVRALFLGACWPVSVLLIIVSKQKRTLHDLLAGTYVIQVVDAAEAAGTASGPLAAAAAATMSSPAPATAAAPIPAVEPAPAVAPYIAPAPAAAPVPADFAPPPTASALDFPAPTPLSTEFAPPPMASATDFPPPPTSPPDPTAYAPPPMEPAAEAPTLGPQGGWTGATDEHLYAPPPLVEPTAPTAPAHAQGTHPPEREVYSPQPGQISERAVKAAGSYTVAPDLSAPAASSSAAPAEQPRPATGEPEAPT
ncbi:MAG: RDD family protein, partial [Candidatus Dormibacteraeota bacterium]|nr:RDD family protein [Candidatus Dormibacteraeota bacterium]